MKLLQLAIPAGLALLAIHAYAIDCDGLDKKTNAYQTCMLRKENADREWNREQREIKERKDQELRDYLRSIEPRSIDQNALSTEFTRKQNQNFSWIKMKIGYAFESIQAGKCDVARDALANADKNIIENGTQGSGTDGNGNPITWVDLKEIHVAVRALYIAGCQKDDKAAREFLKKEAAGGSLAAKELLAR